MSLKYCNTIFCLQTILPRQLFPPSFHPPQFPPIHPFKTTHRTRILQYKQWYTKVPLFNQSVQYTFNNQSMSKQEIDLLTPKECAVLELLATGKLYKEMADDLKVNINTIKKHCKNIYKKLSVRNRTEATLKFNSAKAA